MNQHFPAGIAKASHLSQTLGYLVNTLNKLTKTAVTVPLLLAVSGCKSNGTPYGEFYYDLYDAAFRDKIRDTSKLSSEEQKRLQRVKILASAEGLEGIPKGEVVGLSCKLAGFKWIWEPKLNEMNGLTPEDAALTQLRLKAMLKGANTVIAPSCTHKEAPTGETTASNLGGALVKRSLSRDQSLTYPFVGVNPSNPVKLQA